MSLSVPLISEVSKKVVSLVSRMGEWSLNILKDEFTAIMACEAYLSRYIQRHGQIKILGMAQAVSLRNIYTTVQTVAPTAVLKFESLEELEESFRNQNKRGFLIEGDRRDGMKIANEEKFLTVLGQPGAGKSTFLKRVGLQALLEEDRSLLSKFRKESEYEHECIPVFLELKTIRFQKSVDLFKLVQEEFETCGFTSKFAEQALEEGSVLVLLDGLDEVPSDALDHSIKIIHDFVARFAKNRYIISCRTAFYKSWFPQFTDVVLADFDTEQIKRFIGNWFGSEPDAEQRTAEKCFNALMSPKSAATLELARTPLLLTFICLVFARTQQFPSSRSSLCDRALHILLEEWAAEKRVLRDPLYEGFHADLELILLSQIAGQTFEQEQLFFHRSELIGLIKAFLTEELNAPKHVDAGQLLDAIELQQGLLVERSHNVYSFSHLTLHEYLAGLSIKNEERSLDLIEEVLFEPRWREVILHICGISRADSLLIKMVQTVKRVLADDVSTRAVLNYVASFVPQTSGAECSVSRRILAVSMLIQWHCNVRASFSNDFERVTRRSHVDVLISVFQDLAVRLSSDADEVMSTISLFISELGMYRPEEVALSSAFDLRLKVRHMLMVYKRLVDFGLFEPSRIILSEEEVSRPIDRLREFASPSEKVAALAESQKLLGGMVGLGDFDSPVVPESGPWEKCVKAYDLILDCKEGALSVSNVGWRHSLEEFFLT